MCDSEECSAECAAEADGVLSPDTMYVSLDEVLMGTRVLALGSVLSFFCRIVIIGVGWRLRHPPPKLPTVQRSSSEICTLLLGSILDQIIVSAWIKRNSSRERVTHLNNGGAGQRRACPGYTRRSNEGCGRKPVVRRIGQDPRSCASSAGTVLWVCTRRNNPTCH